MESSTCKPLVVPEVEVLAIEQLLPLVVTGVLIGMTGPFTCHDYGINGSHNGGEKVGASGKCILILAKLG